MKKRDREEYLADEELCNEIPTRLDERLLCDQQEAARIRDAILEGYQDAVAGRTVLYQGDLRQLLKQAAE